MPETRIPATRAFGAYTVVTPGNISLRKELKATLVLAGPIVLNQVGHMSMGMVDTVVGGRLGTTTLAGLGLGANYFWTFTSVCVGCLLALDTYFSQAVGARDDHRLAEHLRQSWWSCAVVTLLSAVGVLAGDLIYSMSVPKSEVTQAFRTYVHIVTWCLPSLFVFFVLQRYWQARHHVLGFTVIILGANVLNLASNLALGLGWWGFPRLGITGLAWATVISRYAMLGAALAYTWFRLRPASVAIPRPNWAAQHRFFVLGLPAAGHTALEVGAFTAAAFVASALGAAPLAAHHVCLMMAAFTFMFPLGFSSAAAVRVGNYIGAGEPERARVAGWLCIALAVTIMSGFALCYLVFPRFLLGLFTQDPVVIGLGVKILVLVALFQIADGTQVSTTGALRGLGNTRAAMVANLIGHYPVGLVLGLIFCFPARLGVVGLWVGLAAGLISVALMLLRVWTVMARDIHSVRPAT